MLDLLDLHAGITLDTREYERALSKAEKDAGKSGDAISGSINININELATRFKAVSNAAANLVQKAGAATVKQTSDAADSLVSAGSSAGKALADASRQAAASLDRVSSKIEGAQKRVTKAAEKVANTDIPDTVAAVADGADDANASITELADNIDKTMGKLQDGLKKSSDIIKDTAKQAADTTGGTSSIGAALGGKLTTLLGNATGGGGNSTFTSILSSGSSALGSLGGKAGIAGGIIGAIGSGLDMFDGWIGKVVGVCQSIFSVVTTIVTTIVDKVGDAGKYVIDTINGISGAAVKASTVIIGAATAATAAITKQAIDAYGDFEQLAGGVETIFGEGSDASETIKNFARNAYGSLQMSANEYLQNVTTFSATLLQKLEPSAAAEKANQALSQIADNYNKMGTSIETAAYAYQGLAKQNATMLDNLYLGYGGNQGELARLLNDSGVLGDVVADEKNVWDVASFDKIIDAIGVIQERLGMAGTAADEAARTVQGSTNKFIASWKNLLTGLGDGEADVEELTNDVVESFDGMLANVLPVAERVVNGLGDAIAHAGPAVKERLSAFIKNTLPSLIKSGTALASSAVDVILDALPDLVDSLAAELDSVLASLDANEFAKRLADVAVRIADTLATHAPSVITAWYTAIATFIDTVLGQIAQDPQAFASKLADILAAIAGGFVSVIESVAPYVPAIIDGLVSVFTSEENLARFGEIGRRLLDAIAAAFDIAGEDGGIDGTKLGQKIVDTLVAIGDFIADSAEQLHIGDFVTNLIDSLLSQENVTKLNDTANKILDALGFSDENLDKIFNRVIDTIETLIDKNQERIKAVFTKVSGWMIEAFFEALKTQLGLVMTDTETVSSYAPVGTAGSAGALPNASNSPYLTDTNGDPMLNVDVPVILDGDEVGRANFIYQKKLGVQNGY